MRVVIMQRHKKMMSAGREVEVMQENLLLPIRDEYGGGVGRADWAGE